MKRECILFISLLLAWQISCSQISAGGIEIELESNQIEQRINRYSIGDLWLMRNYLFAKHGHRFKNQQLASFFSEHYEFKDDSGNAYERLSESEKSLVRLLHKEEKAKRKARTQLIILKDTFSIQDGQLKTPDDERYALPKLSGVRYLSGRKLSPQTYLISLESDYFIGDVECCGGVGAKNKAVQEFLYQPHTRELRAIPPKITEGHFVARFYEERYLFVLDEILSGIHTLQIYSAEDFQLVVEIEELDHIRIDKEHDRIMIWQLTKDVLEYPYRNRRLLYFQDGKINPTDRIEKIDASLYYAG